MLTIIIIFHCTQNFSCPEEYPLLSSDNRECQILNEKNIQNIIDTLLNFEDDEEMMEDEEINNHNKMLENFESILTSDNYDLTNIDKGEEQILKAKKLIITITNLQNQKNNIKNNMSTIDLGECENLLRKYYNLTNNETIYMKKIDIIQDRMTAKKIKYNVYSKLSGKNLVKLNLTICENAKIYINIPIEINGNVDKLNTSSGYFNDICYATTSEDGTDISLQDRKKEYIDGDNIICQDDCEFSSYNSEYKSARCDCFAKEFNSSYIDMTIIKNKLFENFKDIKNLMNYNILICYKKLLPIKRLAYNVGCIIILFFIFFHIISFFLFYICQLKKIKKAIQNIIFALTNMSLIKNFNINTNRMKTKNITQRNNNINKSNNWINGKNKIEEQNQNKLTLNKNNFLDKNKNRKNAKKTTNIITENINSTNRSSF